MSYLQKYKTHYAHTRKRNNTTKIELLANNVIASSEYANIAYD